MQSPWLVWYQLLVRYAAGGHKPAGRAPVYVWIPALTLHFRSVTEHRPLACWPSSVRAFTRIRYAPAGTATPPAT